MKPFYYYIFFLVILVSCEIIDKRDSGSKESTLEYGGDFSLMKKIEDTGGLYKDGKMVKDGYEIFNENGYTWTRLRLLHTPDMVAGRCNSLNYTIESALKAKKFGFKVLLNIHYSDKPTNPGHQQVPAAWKNLTFETLQDSIYNYTKNVIDAMNKAGVLPDMVQIGNEINNGMIWPHGKLWNDSGEAKWENISTILKSAIRGVKESKNGARIPILINASNGGDVNSSYNFYKNIIDNDVDFDIIGLTYYPWWHGTFVELEANILFLSSRFTKNFSIVETAYYSSNWYPDSLKWGGNFKPFPPTETGQAQYLVQLAKILKENPRIKTVFYYQPDIISVKKSDIEYNARSLFSPDGVALPAISAWKK